MANTQGATYSFMEDMLNAKQAFGTTVVRATTDPDDFRGALYSTAAPLGPSTPAYTASGEVTGAGYTAGGNLLTFGTPPSIDGTAAIVTPSAALTFPTVSIGPFDCLLLYNDTLVGKNSVGAFTFPPQTIAAGNFSLTMPVNAAGTALIELGLTPP